MCLKSARILPFAWIAAYSIAVPAAPAQESAKPDAKKETFLRVNLLPVGDFPVTGAIIVNDRPVVIMPKPSELIPNPVFLKKGKDYLPLNIGLNAPSAPVRRPIGSTLDIMTRKDDGNYDGYVTVTLPEGKEDTTVFLLRNKESRSWLDTPRTIVFKNGVESFPLGSARLINFSTVSLRATVNDKDYIVPPKSFKVIADLAKQGGETYCTYAIVAKIGERNLTLANTAVAFDAPSRMNLLMYDRDGKSEIRQEGDDRPVKIVKYFELPYVPPPDPSAPEPQDVSTPTATATPAVP